MAYSLGSGRTTTSCESITSLKSSTKPTSKETDDTEFFTQLEGLDTEGKDWCASYSLKSLKLTLEDILSYAKIERHNVLVEFPFFHYLKALNKIEEFPQSPSRPQPQLNQSKLAQKRKELRLLVRFYENRIHWLCHNSRRYFGLIRGNRIAMIVESSDKLFSLGSGVVVREYNLALTKLVEEQLEIKELVYCIEYGSSPKNIHPEGFPFSRFSKHCVQQVKEWINGLNKTGTNNLYSAFKMALAIKDLDTIVVIVTTLPDQPLSVIHHYMVDKLAGEKRPKLHLIAFRASLDVQTSFRELARESYGHYHGYSPSLPNNNLSQNKSPNTKKAKGGNAEQVKENQVASDIIGELVEDSDVDAVKEEISKARKILIDIESVKSGLLDHSLLEQLRELSVSIDWEEDDNFLWQASPAEKIFKRCSTFEWAKNFGLNSQNLNLYSVLAPDAYPQLQDYVNSTKGTVVSQVYDIMPLLPWKDGSMKYIHVDMHKIEQYVSTLDAFIVNNMLERLGWQISGSRVPFGMLVEGRILVLLDCSCAIMKEMLGLQQHLRMLIKEQLAYTHDFNFVSYGKTCKLWTSGFAEPHRQSLLQAWEWVLAMSPAGSADLLTALKMIFESSRILDDKSEEEYENTVGVYLVATALPDQSTDILCTYLEHVLSGLNVCFHVIFYDTEPLEGHTAFQLGGGSGGRCGLEGQVKESLMALANVGRGTFHHFKVSGVCEGDELTKMVDQVDIALGYANTAKGLLQHYRQFCKRHMHPEVCINKKTSCLSPLPAYPRQTTASLARMNCCLSQKEETERKRVQGQKQNLRDRNKLYSVKSHSWYTGRGLSKVNICEFVRLSTTKKLKTNCLIPMQEEFVSSKKWVSMYGLDALKLTFDMLTQRNDSGFGSGPTYKHYNSQGKLVELQVNPQGLKDFRHKMRTALARYCKRLQWLIQDYRQYLGVVCDKEVVVLVDMSSSMSTHLPIIQQALISFLNDIPKKMKRFNLIAYSNQVKQWCTELQSTHKTERNPGHSFESAIQWIKDLQAEGSSYLLQAIKVCLDSKAQGIYLVTDGSTDHSHDFLLQQLACLHRTYKTEWSINTVGWHSSKKSASFLRELALRTGGRYHQFPDYTTSDDYMVLHKEIIRTEKELKKVDDFK